MGTWPSTYRRRRTDPAQRPYAVRTQLGLAGNTVAVGTKSRAANRPQLTSRTSGDRASIGPTQKRLPLASLLEACFAWRSRPDFGGDALLGGVASRRQRSAGSMERSVGDAVEQWWCGRQRWIAAVPARKDRASAPRSLSARAHQARYPDMTSSSSTTRRTG